MVSDVAVQGCSRPRYSTFPTLNLLRHAPTRLAIISNCAAPGRDFDLRIL
jgi:hypothetical protein